MTKPNADWLSGIKPLLDAFRPPAPRLSFAEDIVAAALVRRAQTQRGFWPNRSRRTGWARTSLIAGSVSLGLVSAAAAATGWFGEKAMQLPVIATIARALPVSVKLTPIQKKPEKLAVVTTETPVTDQFTQPEPVSVTPEELKEISKASRIRRFADTFEQRISMREQRRLNAGLSSDSEQDRALLAALRAADNDADRIVVFNKIRQLHITRMQEMHRTSPAGNRRFAGVNGFNRPPCTAAQMDDPLANGCRPPHRIGPSPFAGTQGVEEPTAGRPMLRRLIHCGSIPLDRPVPRHCRTDGDSDVPPRSEDMADTGLPADHPEPPFHPMDGPPPEQPPASITEE